MTARAFGDPRHWHAMSVDEVVTALESDLDQGLEPVEAAQRLVRFGPNVLPDAARRSLAAVLINQLRSPLIYLLLVAGGIAVALGERTDAIVIFVVVILNALIGAFQEGRAERALSGLRRVAQNKARVLRGGREGITEERDVVPGDIILVSAGDAVAADGRLVDGSALEVAEAALTGESIPVGKGFQSIDVGTALADRRNMIYAGTHVTAGRARAIVIGTGLETEVGRIAAMTEAAEQPKTPLERRIEQFGKYVIVGAIAVFVVILAVGRLRAVPFGEMFMIGVSALVGMVPEGLPVAMTIALAVGVQRMARRRAVVRRLSAVETLGSTTVICSDKTGTLTRNEMTVTAIYLPDGRQVSVSGIGYDPSGHFFVEGREIRRDSDHNLRAILEAGVLCNDAQLHEPTDHDTGWKPVGDPTEVALLTVAIKGGVAPAEIRSRFQRQAELPFDPAHKLMAVQYESTAARGESSEEPFVVIKGAPEAVLDLCSTVRLGDSVVEFTGRTRAEVQSAADEMASRALRLLAVAVAKNTGLDTTDGFATLKDRATFLGLVGQFDPPRAEAARAVKECRNAGIRPVVVTGDHKGTALAAARELGIAQTGDIAVDGVELEKMSADLDEHIENISVFARVHPGQKLRIVEAYQKRGHVVAMTGDGVNDAPALVRADVGVAMGVIGTEAAKDAAKIVITDDNFATIVAAVEEGRLVYRNIKKVVLLLFSTSVAEVVILLVAMGLGYPPPFAAVQILWNNLVTEGVVTVNLIMEPAEGDEMRRRPISPNEPLLTAKLMTRMSVMVPAIVLSTLGWFMTRTAAGVPAAQVQTETFVLLAVCEWFNTLNCRSDRKSALGMGLFKNPWLLGGLVVGNLLQLAVVFWRPLGDVLHTVPFGFGEFVALGLVGSLVLWAEEARKLIERRRPADRRD